MPPIEWATHEDVGYRYLSRDEVGRLLAAAPEGLWRTLILFIVTTGARYNEAVALKWSDLRFDEKQPVAHLWTSASNKTKSRLVGPTKTKVARDVPLLPAVITALQALRHDRPFVFNPSADRPLPHQTAIRHIHKIAHCAGVETSWHPLRHTIATDLTAEGVSLRVVQELLGHTTLAMTTRYAHVAPSTVAKSLEKLSYRDAIERAVGHQNGHQAHDLVDKSSGSANVTP